MRPVAGSLTQRLPSGPHAASSDVSSERTSSSGLPPSSGRRSTWFFTPWVPITDLPSGDTRGLLSWRAPGMGTGASASRACRTRCIMPSVPIMEYTSVCPSGSNVR